VFLTMARHGLTYVDALPAGKLSALESLKVIEALLQ